MDTEEERSIVGVEIERKFLVRGEGWRDEVEASIPMDQGYLSTTPEHTIRVRQQGEEAVLTIKGPARGLVRPEFEVGLEQEMARDLLAQFCQGRRLKKVRHLIRRGSDLWEVDVFEGENQGLVVAEIELRRPDQEVELPEWVGEEVTGDPRYYNARLVEVPFTQW